MESGEALFPLVAWALDQARLGLLVRKRDGIDFNYKKRIKCYSGKKNVIYNGLILFYNKVLI